VIASDFKHVARAGGQLPGSVIRPRYHLAAAPQRQKIGPAAAVAERPLRGSVIDHPIPRLRHALKKHNGWGLVCAGVDSIIERLHKSRRTAQS
jgi:hypothetical protein